MTSSTTYIDLFAGCGGLSLGLMKAGLHGLFAVEKDALAFETLQHNLIESTQHFSWPEWLPKKAHDINGLIKTYRNEIRKLKGNINLIVGGPPCQGFSVNGRREEKDRRNSLADAYVDFVGLVRPEMILFENVKGFTMEFAKKGTGTVYSDHVIQRLRALDYDVEAKLLNFGNYGIPQRRWRFILVGKRRGEAKEFFETMDAAKLTFLKSRALQAQQTVSQAISDLHVSHGTLVCPESARFLSGRYGAARTAYQKLMRSGISNKAPDSHRFANHTPEIEERFTDLLESAPRNKQLSAEIRVTYQIKKRSITPLDPSKLSPTITSLPDDYIHYQEPRVLTVRECARIQSFPDSFEFKGNYTSGGDRRAREVPRYTQVGNAIPPLFAEMAGLALKEILSDA
jgi:DNA (cytosine-5)-methyltransferase 1